VSGYFCGTHAFNLTLNNDGGRSVGRLNGNDYGVTRTHLTDNNVLLWNFDIKLDNLSNTGNETKLKVRLTSPKSTQLLEINITDSLNQSCINGWTLKEIPFKVDTIYIKKKINEL
jgi:hypothetical protein